MDNQGVLAVISGFSGAGKGTLMRALLERYLFFMFSSFYVLSIYILSLYFLLF